MKRSALLITAFAAFALGGCGMGVGDNTFTGTYVLPSEVTEAVTNADGTTDTYVTRISYDADALVSREVTTKNDITYRELKDYKRELNDDGDLVVTRTRVITDEEGSVTHTLVSTHGESYNQQWLETKFEVFAQNSTEPTEWMKVDYNDDRHIRYESWTPEKGRILRTRYNYSSASKPILTYREEVKSEDGTTTISETNVGVKSMTWGMDQFKPYEYELYRNIPSLNGWNGDDGDLVEKKSGYAVDNGVETWTVYKYGGELDNEGKPVPVTTSRFTMRTQSITVAW